MKIYKEDTISVLITLLLLLIWYLTLLLFRLPLLSISILWSGMILLSLIYVVIYRRKNRDMRVFKYRFLLSAVPIYPVLAYYIYCLIKGEGLNQEFIFLPIAVVFTMLFLNALVVYYFDTKK